jgi:hypothetical protein
MPIKEGEMEFSYWKKNNSLEIKIKESGEYDSSQLSLKFKRDLMAHAGLDRSVSRPKS